jgi:hypothetical protein
MHQWKQPNTRQTAGSPMSHIQLPEGLPGIRGPRVFSPETTKYGSREWPTTG